MYIDDRPRNGHKNATVFLVNVLKNITENKLIFGCRVGNNRAVAYEWSLIGETPYWRNWKFHPEYKLINHEEVLIDCFDVPAQDGDLGYVFYKTSESSGTEMAVSERVVRRPLPRVKPTSPEGVKYGFTVLTCTKVFGDNAPWFIEWLTYQKHIGVDHVHLNVDESFLRDLSKEKMEYVLKEMKSGFLSVEPWVLWLINGKEVYYHNQGLKLEDCAYRFRGTYDFMFILDTDDFFVPRVPGESKVHYYLNQYFKDPSVGSCKLRWVEYFPDEFLKKEELLSLKDGNVTSLLSDFSHLMQENRKSVHRTETLVDTATHFAFKMVNGFQIYEPSVKVAYIAHVRNERKRTDYRDGISNVPP